MRVRFAALALALVFAACGGGGDDSEGSGPTGAADDDIAQAANFRLTDFPPGWERSPGALQRPDGPDDRRFAECLGRPYASEIRTSLANSDNFATGELTRANSSAQVMRTQAIAEADFAALRSERALGCLGQRLDAQLAEQSPQGASPFTRRSLQRAEVPPMGDETLGFRMVVDAPSVAAGATLVVDQVFVRKGRVEISTSFVEKERPFPDELRHTLLTKLVERAG